MVSTAAGKHPQADPHEDNSVPDPTQLTEDVSNAKEATKGKEPTAEHDRTRVPVSNAVWDKARPVMHLIADLVDTWERFGNMLSPTAPFPRRRPRLLLASCLVPVLIGSYFTTSYMAMKGAGFGMGFGFFGDPLITPGIEFINRTYPKWQKYVELRHTLLRGIPTNAQLAVTLLRIGEKNKAPIPPPPSSSAPPPVEPHATAGEGLEHLGMSHCRMELLHMVDKLIITNPTRRSDKRRDQRRCPSRSTSRSRKPRRYRADQAQEIPPHHEHHPRHSKRRHPHRPRRRQSQSKGRRPKRERPPRRREARFRRASRHRTNPFPRALQGQTGPRLHHRHGNNPCDIMDI